MASHLPLSSQNIPGPSFKVIPSIRLKMKSPLLAAKLKLLQEDLYTQFGPW